MKERDTMPGAIVPMDEISNRLPEQGRIRFGVKTAKAMKSIDTLRFTSQDKVAIEEIAKQYGGVAKPWEDPKAAPGQYEVITDASEVPIVLPPDPLGGTPVYELWTAGGCQRRCDGSEGPDACQTYQRVKDNEIETINVACICRQRGALACKPKLRLSIILPTIRFGGVWRLDTSSWNAMHELPQQVRLIQAVQQMERQQGVQLTRAFLGLKHDIADGGKKQFVYPVIRQAQSFDEILAGHSNVQALGQASLPERQALNAGQPQQQQMDTPAAPPQARPPVEPPAPPAAEEDDDIAEGEIVHEGGDETPPTGAVAPPWDAEIERLGLNKNRLVRLGREIAGKHNVQPPMSYDQVKAVKNPDFHRDLYEAAVADSQT